LVLTWALNSSASQIKLKLEKQHRYMLHYAVTHSWLFNSRSLGGMMHYLKDMEIVNRCNTSSMYSE